jgi:plastocyanin
MTSSVAAPTSGAVLHGNRTSKAKWSRVATLGFLLMAGALTLWVVGGLIAGQSLGEEAMFFGGGIAAALAGATLVWKSGTVGKAIGALLAALMIAAFFWVAFSLGVPNAFVEFSGAVMFVMGAFVALGYSIGAIVRRNDQHVEATRGEMRAMRVMLAIVTLAMVVSAVLNVTTRSSVAAPEGSVAAEMSSFKFAPSTYEATAGSPTQFVIHNGDAFTHDFAIDALNLNSGLIAPGSDKLVEVNAPAGEYVIRCTLHSGDSQDPADVGEGMTALLTVK